MTAEEIEAALSRGAWVAPAEKPNPARPVSEVIGCSDAHALTMARSRGLIDADNVLHCWTCKEPTDWHVSLHCAPCRVESQRNAPERQRLERERQRAERERQQQEPSRPRVANRSFRDEY